MNNIKYFIYARKSSENEDKQVASIPSQIEELKKLADQNNLKIVGILTEEKSAKAPGRPVFTAMLERIHKGEAQGIICWKLDRLARNPIDGGNISWMLQQNMIKHIQTYQRAYLPTDNVLMMGIEFGMANQYVIDLSVNVKRGMRKKVSDGWLPHIPPLGYLNNRYNEPTKPPIYPDEKRFFLIKQLWHLLLEKHYSLNQLRKIADEMGLTTRTGTKLAKSQFFYIFSNPFYYGKFIWNNDLYQGKHEPMITKAEFDRAQDIISGKQKSKPHYLQFAFTGLIRCSECGASITAEKKTKHQKNGNVHNYTYYRCTRQIKPDCSQKPIKEEELEKQFADILGTIEIPAEFHAWAIKYLKEEQTKEKEDREKIIQIHRDNLDFCKRKIDTLFSMRFNNEVEAEEFKQKKNDLMKEKTHLIDLLNDAEDRANTWLERAEKLLSLAETAKTRFETGTLAEKKEILQALGSNLYLNNRTLSIELSQPLKIVKCLAPDLKILHNRLEPVLSVNPCLKTENLELEYAKNEKWLGWKELNPH